jgi:hypothetical protein
MNTIEKAWQWFLIALATTLVTCLIFVAKAPKHTVRYEIDYSSSDHGVPAIRVDVENGTDNRINLSKEISWSKAIQLVDSLNQTLKPIK